MYRYVSHPQYTGFIIVILGFLVQWPTILTLLMAPVLIWRYVFLAKKEEKAMLSQYPKEYAAYLKGRPRFIPKFSDLFSGRHKSSSDRNINTMKGAD